MTIKVRQLDDRAESPWQNTPSAAWISPSLTAMGYGPVHSLDPGMGPGRFDRARILFEEWVQAEGIEPVNEAVPYAFASFTFDEDSPGSVVLIPDVVIIDRGGRSWIITATDEKVLDEQQPMPRPMRKDRPRFAGSSLPDHLWLEAVAQVLEAIKRAEVEKVVLARDHAIWSKEPFDPDQVLANLRQRFPECYTFLVDGLVGASPELLIKREDLTVTSRALAGSAPRSDDRDEDERLGKELLASDKDQREHALAAASVGRVLGEVCRDLSRSPAPELLKLANVTHLATAFAGTLAEPHHVLELVARLHPTAAVGGTPTATALEIIRRMEGMDRRRYAGPVGYFDLEGDGEFAIALRCAELSGARARLFAGAGLVAGSVPEDELEETRLKLRAMLSALE